MVLLVEGDAVDRHPLAEYLRACRFTVFEAATGDEAMAAFGAPGVVIDAVIADMQTSGSGFGLRRWIMENHPSVRVILAGSLERAVEKAAEICEDGPGLAKPYEHRLVLDAIRQALAQRERNKRR